MKISAELWSFLVAILATLTFAGKVPDFKIKTLTMNSTPGNPYFGNWSAEMSESGDSLSMLSPILKDLPENIMFGLEVELNGRQVFAVEMTICDGLEAGLVDQTLLDHVYPQGMFQPRCPVKAGDYALKDYSFTADNTPFDIAAGELFVKLSYFEPNGQTIFTSSLEGLISYK